MESRTKVVVIRPGDLPRVSARQAEGLTRAARLVSGKRGEIALGDFGAVAVEARDVDGLRAGTQTTADVVLGISRGGRAGRLVIDAALARRAVALALGGAAPVGAALAPLGPGERGIVAGIVASLLHGLEAPFSVSLVAPALADVAENAEDGDAGGVSIRLAVTVTGGRGWARLEVPASWLAEAASSRAVAGAATDLAALEVQIAVELARTSLTLGELAAVVPGDAVVFDGEPSVQGGVAARAVRVVVGPHAAPARLAADGLVTLEDRLRPIARGDRTSAKNVSDGEVTMNEVSVNEVGVNEVGVNNVGVNNDDEAVTGRHGEPGVTADATVVLAAAPIEVVAELGRVTLRGEEVVGLGPGAVLALGRPGAAPVTLRVGDEVWAEGELCDVDGVLGVRVTASRRSGFPR